MRSSNNRATAQVIEVRTLLLEAVLSQHSTSAIYLPHSAMQNLCPNVPEQNQQDPTSEWHNHDGGAQDRVITSR
jgi:hypothetical protein